MVDRRKKIILFLVLALPVLAGAQGPAELKTFTAVGTAPVSGANPQGAREAALADGLQAAVAQAAMEVLGPESFAENLKKLNPILLDRPEGWIQEYKVLAEAVSGKQHRTVVQAAVSVLKLREALAGTAGIAGATSAAPAQPLTLTVEGTDRLAGYVKFRKALGAADGVESFQVREMRVKEAVLSVNYRGSARDLAARLMQPPFDAFGLAVLEEGEGALRVKLPSSP
jgi:hypothetical protein